MASLIRSNKTMLKVIAVVAGLLMYATGLQVAFAEHGTGTLNAEPENGKAIVGTTYIFKATMSDDSEKVVNIDAEVETVSDPTPPNTMQNEGTPSPSDPEDPNAATYTAPDMTCDIPVGETWCYLEYKGDTAGKDQICVWVDEDNEDETAGEECEEEVDPADPSTSGNTDGCADIGPTNPTGEPDCTDVVTVTWSTDEGTTLDCDDAGGTDRERETNGAGQSETYTCRLREAPGNGGSGMVYGENISAVNDPDAEDDNSFDSPDYMCVTDGNGNCNITVTQSANQQGTAQICFWSHGTGSGESAGGDSGLCGNEDVPEEQQPNLSDAGNDMADSVELTWSAAATSGGTTTSGTGTSGTRPPGGTTTTTTSSRTTGGMTTPPGQSTSTTTTTTTTTQRQSVATNLSIGYRRGKFSGSVGSSKTRCQSGRRITLKKKKPGRDRTLGTTRSRRNSKWSISKRARRGQYYAVAAKKVYTAQDGTIVTCKPDRSPTIRP